MVPPVAHTDVGSLASVCTIVFAASWWFNFNRPVRKRRLPIKTQKGPRGVKLFIPQNPCPRCKGTGKSTCGHCGGRGRLNHKEVAVLPKGEYPQWCRSCMGSGMWFCERCMGTGIKRGKIGFRINDDDDD